MKGLLIAFALLGAAACAAGEDRLKALILTGQTDPAHDWRVTTPLLKEILESTGRFEVRVADRVSGLTAEDLAPYDVLVLHYNGPRWAPETESAVEQFVRSGKGMISLHGVTYGALYGMVFDGRWKLSPEGDQGWTAYPRLIGATWEAEKIGHSARHVFTVKWTDRQHPVAQGLEESFTADDELYHRLTLLPDTRILATAYSDPEKRGTGKDEPIIWWAPFGQGRVLHITLGHDPTAMRQPGFAAAFARGSEWVATGRLTPARRVQ